MPDDKRRIDQRKPEQAVLQAPEQKVVDVLPQKELSTFERLWKQGYPQYRDANDIEITTIDDPKDLTRGTVGFRDAIGDKNRWIALSMPAEKWLELKEWIERKFGGD